MDGAGGNGNPYICKDKWNGSYFDPGENGDIGENCGNINIHNSLKVLAYGGKGGGGSSSSSGSGRRRWWLPWCTELVGGGAGRWAEAILLVVVGGFSGGNAEYLNESSQNGNAGRGGTKRDCSSSTATGGTGGSGYLEKAENTWTLEDANVGMDYWTTLGGEGYREIAGNIGGGGSYTKYMNWNFEHSGDGGVAGKGGTIKVSQNASIEAYNGNKYTDNSGQIDYCPIYIQNGELLEITTSLGFWTNQDNKYYSALFGTEVNYTTTWGTENGNDHVAELREYSTDEGLKLSYINPVTKSNQGIGSGAGYIELSNGTYEVDPSLN